MDLGPAILWLLSSDNALSRSGAIVGPNVFPDELPQKPPYPSLVYTLISAPRTYNMEGQNGATPFRYQIDAFAATASALQILGTAVLADLSGFAGTIPVSPEIRIQAIFADNEGDSAERDLEASGPRIKRKSFDFILWTREG